MKRIYVAEDTPEDALIVRAVLEGVAELTFFTDGLQLYRAVRRDAPDLLVLDIILPTLSGLAISRLLKFHRDYAAIPIVMASSIMDANVRERARQCGVDAFLSKPYDPEKLLGEVAERL